MDSLCDALFYWFYGRWESLEHTNPFWLICRLHINVRTSISEMGIWATLGLSHFSTWPLGNVYFLISGILLVPNFLQDLFPISGSSDRVVDLHAPEMRMYENDTKNVFQRTSGFSTGYWDLLQKRDLWKSKGFWAIQSLQYKKESIHSLVSKPSEKVWFRPVGWHPFF